MLTLLFSDQDALGLTLRRGVLPPEVVAAPVRFGIDERRRVWIQPEVALPRDLPEALERLGIAVLVGESEIELESCADWLHLIPLRPASPGNPSSILLELRGDHLPAVVAEIRRLMPQSRITLRMADWWDGRPTVLVWMTEVPPYTLHRSGDDAWTAFSEQAPSVWVQVGWEHPFAGLVRPAADSLTLIRAPNRWSQCDILPTSGETGSFPLPQTAVTLRDRADIPPCEVPLRLVAAPRADPPELWVITDNPEEQLEAMAGESSPEFLARFRFATVAVNDRKIGLLWAKPSRVPPTPALSAVGYRPFRELPDLFLPCDRQLSFLLRCDFLRTLATTDHTLTLLLPEPEGRFATVAVSRDAFEPLEQWLEHRVPSPQPLVAADRQAALEWQSFEELTESEPRSKRSSPESTPRARADRPGILTRLRRMFQAEPRVKRPATVRSVKDDAQDFERAFPDVPSTLVPDQGARKHDNAERRARLETKFLESQDPEDLAKRLVILPELAGLKTRLGDHADAAVCWLHALWDHPVPPRYWYWGWLQAERKQARVTIPVENWRLLLEFPPAAPTIRLLAATAVWQSGQPEGLGELDGRVIEMVEAHEEWLPVRAVWLFQLAMYATTGDRLRLMRGADRLHERLYRHGLNLERDAPSFLRFAGGQAAERFQSVREWLERVRDPIHRWVNQLTRSRPSDYVVPLQMDFPDSDGRRTKAIVDLILAWGMARLGEQSKARLFAESATAVLRQSREIVPDWIADAMEHRVNQVLDQKPPSGAFPPKLLAVLEPWQSDCPDEVRFLARYRINMLRSRSRVLDPDWEGCAYQIPPSAIGDPESVIAEVRQMLAAGPAEFAAARRLEQVMQFASGFDDDQGSPILAAVDSVLDQWPEPVTGLILLRGRLRASLKRRTGIVDSSGIARVVRQFATIQTSFAAVVERMRAPVERGGTDRPDEWQRFETFPALAVSEVLRLGQPELAERFQTQMVEWILGGKELSQIRSAFPHTWRSSLRALLHVCANWFGTTHEDRAIVVLDFARDCLFRTPDRFTEERLALAQAYAEAGSHAQPRVAQGRIEEIFRDLSGLHDTRQTNAEFALSPIALVDSVVRAAVSDAFSLGSAARRRLDEDEFQIQKRVRQDLEAFVTQAIHRNDLPGAAPHGFEMPSALPAIRLS